MIMVNIHCWNGRYFLQKIWSLISLFKCPGYWSPLGWQSQIVSNNWSNMHTEVHRDILSLIKGPDTIIMRTVDITKINIKWGQWV